MNHQAVIANAAPLALPDSTPSPGAGERACAATLTAADWLISIGPKLAEFREQDRLLAELHSAHVDAWMDADSCAACGDLSPTLRRGKCPACYWEGWSVRKMYEGIYGEK